MLPEHHPRYVAAIGSTYSVEGVQLASCIIENNKLAALEGLVVLHLGIASLSPKRTATGIAGSLNKDRKNITRVLRALEERGLVFKTQGLWSLSPENVVSFSHAGAKS